MIANYSHMIHMDWEVLSYYGGGLLWYRVKYTQNVDPHFIGSDNFTTLMKPWIDGEVFTKFPRKMKTRYICTDPDALHSNEGRRIVRTKMAKKFDIALDSIVLLLAGGYVPIKAAMLWAKLSVGLQKTMPCHPS